YRVEPFNEQDIAQYVRRWFALDETLTPAERDRLVGSFLSESKWVSELVRTPLLLSLICSLYWQVGYIPTSRLDLYERCATMLLETWDKRRGILSSVALNPLLPALLAYIAFRMHEDPVPSKGLTEDELISIAGEYLHHRRFEDLD